MDKSREVLESERQSLGIRIFNKALDKAIPKEAMYIGRPSKFGNPFTHLAIGKTIAETKVETRDDAVKAYESWLLQKVQSDPNFREAVKSLANKDLVCWCWPRNCHALPLAKMAKMLSL